ncbi:MAG: o-succinylbenzoate synthase [bacterium]
MTIDRIELHRVRLPLVRPFRTSSAYRTHIEHILIRLIDENGADGWGEIATAIDPFYNSETTGTAWHLTRDFLGPMVIGKVWSDVRQFRELYGKVKGNRFARSGLEMAAWDLVGRNTGKSLRELLGGTRQEVEVGVSLGIENDISRLLNQVEKFVAEGYKRVKLKIAPGWDLEPVRAVREKWPNLPLQVDANSAYSLNEIDHLKRLDEFQLLLIEQPLADDDILDHAELAKQLNTPICLDESLHHLGDVANALKYNCCKVVNIKVSRVGGLEESRKIAEYCFARGFPVWCGGMHEFGLGRAANLAIASLPGFTLPGDTSGSDKYWVKDIIDPPVIVERGLAKVPEGPGLGVNLVMERVAKYSTELQILTRDSKVLS